MYPGVSGLHGEGSRERIQTYPVLALASHAGRISTYPGASGGSVLLARHGKEMHKLPSQW